MHCEEFKTRFDSILDERSKPSSDPTLPHMRAAAPIVPRG